MIKTVLLDDEYYFRQSLKTVIPWEECGATIIGDANNGETGLELIQKHQADLAIVDINMPIMDGLELIKQIHARGIPCKTIILSGYSEFEYARQAIAYGVFSYQLKPIDKDDFEQSVREAVCCITDERRGIRTPSTKFQDHSRYSKLTQKAISQMKAEFHLPQFNVTQLVNQLHVNYSYLCSSFKKETSMTINDYLLELRIQAACELLRQGGKNISEIAAAVGYDDPSYFSKCFKKSTSLTPSQFIEQINYLAAKSEGPQHKN